ncbi:hypothetical protein EGH24_09880 [Halonotius terrestris]|uniref:Uncharacterized protein n=1 Tax=Halonotius terrestris TaxID=2487750 RepID=A0A8J8PB25_9EURY|nr:hypothetical protein [Halonotius terrestris]TQQ79796.1 hypothetical protein EGH24_09880 [Halonotius terrestris]
MTGAFYGSLAASASVFVAILTALLVNNYVRIKSERRQIKNELKRSSEELQGLRPRRDTHQENVDELEEKREKDYNELAEENVDSFIDIAIPPTNPTPIENITVDELYQQLIDFEGKDSPEDLEKEPIKHRHRDILEDRMPEIEEQILDKITSSFADKYRGRGKSYEDDTDRKSFREMVKEKRQEKQEDGDVDINVQSDFPESLSLEEFIEKYKEKYDLSELNENTVEALETKYDEVVDSKPSLDTPSLFESDHDPSKTSSLLEDLSGPDPVTAGLAKNTVGLAASEQKSLAEEQDELRKLETEINILENREERLRRDLEGLNPEELKPTLWANVATIIFSVVVPIFAYLDTVTEFTIPQLHFINIWMIVISWLLGLIIVFGSILWKINEGDNDDEDAQQETQSNASDASS